PGDLLLFWLVVEHIAAVEHEAGDLQHHEAEDRDQHDRDNADVTERFHAARPLALRRSEKACAASATARAEGDTFGAGAGAGAAGTSASAAGRPARTILERRRITASPSESWCLRCADIWFAAASWLPRFSLTSRTVCLSPPIARSAISVAVISSPMVALSECSSAFSRCSRLLSSMQ